MGRNTNLENNMRKLLASIVAISLVALALPGRLLAHGGHPGGHEGLWGTLHVWLTSPLGVAVGLGALACFAVWVGGRRRRA